MHPRLQTYGKTNAFCIQGSKHQVKLTLFASKAPKYNKTNTFCIQGSKHIVKLILFASVYSTDYQCQWGKPFTPLTISGVPHTLRFVFANSALIMLHCLNPSVFALKKLSSEKFAERSKKLFTLLDLCVSSLRRGHANLLCIVPILTDDPRRESNLK